MIKELEKDLNSRISKQADKNLLIFKTKKDLIQYQERNGKSQNIIYITLEKIKYHGLVGLRYIDWKIIHN